MAHTHPVLEIEWVVRVLSMLGLIASFFLTWYCDINSKECYNGFICALYVLPAVYSSAIEDRNGVAFLFFVSIATPWSGAVFMALRTLIDGVKMPARIPRPILGGVVAFGMIGVAASIWLCATGEARWALVLANACALIANTSSLIPFFALTHDSSELS